VEKEETSFLLIKELSKYDSHAQLQAKDYPSCCGQYAMSLELTLIWQ